MEKQRDNWTSRLGVVLAVAGSAIGLGNFLRFPGVAAQNGGGAFMIPYLLSFLFLALPFCWLEWTLGRFGGRWGQGSAPGVFDRLTAGKRPGAKYLGAFGVGGALGIFFYYVVIESWTLAYVVFSIMGSYAGLHDPAEVQAFFESFLSGVPGPGGVYFHSRIVFYAAFLVTFAANLWVLANGISRGIERFCRWAMPCLFILAAALVVRVFTLGAPLASAGHPDWNVSNALGFLWNPQFSMLRDPHVWLAAAGQVFFSTSVGISALLTYASYVKGKDDVLLGATSAAFLNEVAEVVLGASIVVPAAFLFFGPAGTKAAVAGGTFGLAFQTTPLLFGYMPAGALVGAVWFALLFVAGVTSSVSVLQPSMTFFEEEYGWTRRRTSFVVGAVAFVAANMVIFGKGVLGEMDFWFSTFGLPFFAFIEISVCLRYLGPKRAWREAMKGSRLRLPKACGFVMCYVSPVLIALVLVGWFVTEGWRTVVMGSFVDGHWTWIYPADQLPWIFATRALYLCVLAAFVWLIHHAWAKRRKGAAA